MKSQSRSKRLDELLKIHAEVGEVKAVYPLYDALHYLKYGSHIPEVAENFPQYLASKGLIREVRSRRQLVQSRLRQKYPEGTIVLYRGGDPRGSYWTSSEEMAKIYTEAAPGIVLSSRSVPIKEIVFDPEAYKDAGVKDYHEEEYTILGDTFTAAQLGHKISW